METLKYNRKRSFSRQAEGVRGKRKREKLPLLHRLVTTLNRKKTAKDEKAVDNRDYLVYNDHE